eukprot:8430175-Pyramimonas_sp.AAC.1
MQSGASILRPITIDQKNGDNDRPLMPEEIRHLRGFSERFSGRVPRRARVHQRRSALAEGSFPRQWRRRQG